MRSQRPLEPAESKSPHTRSSIPPDKTRTIMSPLTAFAVSPEGVHFETQESDEEVVLFLRQHLIVLVPSVLLVVLLIVAPILILPSFLTRLSCHLRYQRDILS